MAHILVTGWTPQHQGNEMLKVTTSKDKPAYPILLKKQIIGWLSPQRE
jgi:hypothetical protein